MKKTDLNCGWFYGHPGEEKHSVTLPHDAMLYDGRSPEEPAGHPMVIFRFG